MGTRYLDISKYYSEAVVANSLAFLSDMVPESPETNVRTQTEDILAQIDSWLTQYQSDKTHILKVTTYLPDMNDYATTSEAWDAQTTPEHALAHVRVEAKLTLPDWGVEIKTTAFQTK